MFTDWAVKFRINRQLKPVEKNAKLSIHDRHEVDPDDRGALSAFNSTFVEFVDRRYRLRGGIGTLFALCIVVSFVALPIIFSVRGHRTLLSLDLESFLILCPPIWLMGFFVFNFALKPDLFNYTYRPIRFNRRTRKVYVFREGGRILSMPWEQGFFHIGQGLRDKILLDLRCHILDGETVKDTFAVGHYFDRPEAILGEWEFIRRYMEEGPESVKPPFIGLSVEPTLKNCYIWVTASLGIGSPVMRAVLFPLYGIFVLTRWLALRSSRRPHFPPEIEAECAIDPDDPHDLPKPKFIGEGYNTMSDKDFKAGIEKYMRQRR